MNLSIDTRTAGRIMQGVAAAGLIVAVLGAIVGWSLVGRLDSAGGETLELTAEALVTIEDTVVVADEVVGSTVDALEAVELTLAELVNTADSTQPLLESLADLGTDVAPNLESATETLRALEDVGETIDGLLESVGSLPVVPSYDPDTSLSEQFGQLADDIEPLADTLRETSDRIGPAADGTEALQERVAELETAVRGVRVDLAESEALLSEYGDTARNARSITEETRRGLGNDVLAARILLLIGAAVFAVGQIVPYWFGSELLARTDEVDEILDEEAHDHDALDDAARARGERDRA